MSMRLILVRHGQSEGNASGVIQGHLDFALTDLGEQQARATAERFRGMAIDRVLTSPLRRASTTAEYIAEATGARLESEPALREYDIGHISGLSGREVAERHPEIGQAYAEGRRPSFPGEEGRSVFYARLETVLQRWMNSNETLVAVAHGGVVSALCYMVLGIDHSRPGILSVANCSVTEIGKDRRGRLVVHRQNDVCHLRGIVTVEDEG